MAEARALKDCLGRLPPKIAVETHGPQLRSVSAVAEEWVAGTADHLYSQVATPSYLAGVVPFSSGGQPGSGAVACLKIVPGPSWTKSASAPVRAHSASRRKVRHTQSTAAENLCQVKVKSLQRASARCLRRWMAMGLTLDCIAPGPHNRKR